MGVRIPIFDLALWKNQSGYAVALMNGKLCCMLAESIPTKREAEKAMRAIAKNLRVTDIPYKDRLAGVISVLEKFSHMSHPKPQ